MNFLNGGKTYLSAAGIVLVAIGGFLSGQVDLVSAITQALAGLGLAGLRHGVTKI